MLLQADCRRVRKLGSGGCATVDLYEVRLAVKKPSNEVEAEYLREEAMAMAGMNHPGIAKAACWIQPEDGGPRWLAMPYMAYGSLDGMLWCVALPASTFMASLQSL